MNFNIEKRNLIISIEGEIDHHTCDRIREEIDKEFSRSNAKNIVFDFSNIRFMDSSGIGVIMGRYKNVKYQGGNVVVVNMTRQLERVFELSGLHKIISSFDNINDALEYLQ